MPTVTINQIRLDNVPQGTTILEAARSAGVRIPTLCHLEGVQALGACRVCLVEVKGARTLVASCVTPVADNMEVFTNSRRVRNGRRTVVELLLSAHDGDCQTCERNNDCELQALARELGITEVRYPGQKSRKTADDSTPALVRDAGKCILCRRCVTVCNEIQGVGALFPQNRGFDSAVGPAFCQDLDTVAAIHAATMLEASRMLRRPAHATETGTRD